MKKWYLYAMYIAGVICYVLGFINDEKLYYLLGAIIVVIANIVQLCMTHKNRKKD